MLITKKKVVLFPLFATAGAYVLLGMIEPMMGALVAAAYVMVVLPAQIGVLLYMLSRNGNAVVDTEAQGDRGAKGFRAAGKVLKWAAIAAALCVAVALSAPIWATMIKIGIASFDLLKP